jgi:heterotetrameric sarcosine oxidase gamma subunit
VSNPEPRSAFAPHMKPGRQGAAGPEAVQIVALTRSMVTVAAGRGATPGLAALPGPGRSASIGEVTAYAIAPATWLVAAGGSEPDFVTRITTAAAPARIVDQSFGKATLRISGARVRDVLDKLCRLDLHPTAFPPDMCGITEIAHVAVLIARADSGGPGAIPAFDLVIPSTFAVHVLEAVEMAAAEYGYVVA